MFELNRKRVGVSAGKTEGDGKRARWHRQIGDGPVLGEPWINAGRAQKTKGDEQKKQGGERKTSPNNRFKIFSVRFKKKILKKKSVNGE